GDRRPCTGYPGAPPWTCERTRSRWKACRSLDRRTSHNARIPAARAAGPPASWLGEKLELVSFSRTRPDLGRCAQLRDDVCHLLNLDRAATQVVSCPRLLCDEGMDEKHLPAVIESIAGL